MLHLNPFGPKAHSFAFRPPDKLARVNILTGAIRSAKTTCCIPQIIAACGSKKPGLKLISGVSKTTIKNNILNDVFELVGKGNYNYNAHSGDLTLYGSRFLCVGAKDEGSEKFIRGLTLSWAMCDEVSLMPESFFKQLIGRLSVPGAFLIGTTNPGNRGHWLFEEWIDNEEKKKNGDVYTLQFGLEDNPSLDKDYVTSIKRMYSGVWFKRMILGEWCNAEGIVYKDCFTQDLIYNQSEEPIGLKNEGGSIERLVAVDVGTANDFVALDIYDDGQYWWFADEYRHSGRKSGFQKSNGQYCDDLINFIGPKNNATVIVDPSAAAFKVELSLRGIPYMDADNDVYQGIQTVSSIMTSKRVKFNREKVAATIKELDNYAWDSKKTDRGLEQPVKINDHGADAMRYACQTRFDRWRLQAA